MIRAVVCGGPDLRSAALALGLDVGSEAPDLVLVDADDDAAVDAARRCEPHAARVFVAESARAALLEAAGVPHVVRRPASAATIGPVIFGIERAHEIRPRVLAFVAATGATGRTSLVVNLAARVAVRTPVVALDATGTGALSWRLGKTVAPWSDLAAVGEDLTEAHLRLAAAESDGVLVLGGSGECGEDLLLRVTEQLRGLGVVLVDAPAHPSACRLADLADRVFVCANPDPASAAATTALFGETLARGGQLVVSQADERDAPGLASAFGRQPAFLLPRDEPACRTALLRRSLTGGRLGLAYDAIAEILLADVAS